MNRLSIRLQLRRISIKFCGSLSCLVWQSVALNSLRWMKFWSSTFKCMAIKKLLRWWHCKKQIFYGLKRKTIINGTGKFWQR